MRSAFGPDNQRRDPEHNKPGFTFEELPDGTLQVDDVTAGMVNALPREKIPPGSWEVLRNARTRDDWTGRRPGTAEFGVKPDSEPILRLVTFFNEAGDSSILRITPTSAHLSYGAGEWNALAHDLSGSLHRPDIARMFDWLFFSMPEDRIRVFKRDAMSLLTVEGSPRALTIANFGDRIVAANLRKFVGGVRPSTIAWSANSDPFNWTGTSAGEEDLVQGEAGYSDAISGLFPLTDEMVILRKRSIWHAQRQAFAAAPFRFYRVLSGIGCDLPHTAVEVEGAVLFADQRTKSVYAYQPGSRPQRISGMVKELFTDLQNLVWAKASYDPYHREYHLGLCTSVLTPWITRVWVFSLDKGVWSYDDGPVVSEIGIVSTRDNLTTIDDLIGTIDEQVGTIDELSGDGQVMRPTLFKGTATGEFIQQDYPHDVDWDGSPFEFEAQSQNFGSQVNRRTAKDLLVKIQTDTDAVVTLEHSVNGSDWRNTKSNPFVGSPNDQNARLPKKLTTGPRLFWRLRCSQGLVRIKGYWMRVLEKGLQR